MNTIQDTPFPALQVPIPVLLIFTGLLLGSGALKAQNLDSSYPGQYYDISQAQDVSSYQELFAMVPPEHQAPMALLVELETGTILYAHNASQAHPPASLTKLLTMYTALETWEATGADLDEPVEYSPAAWWTNAPPQSSLMFLGPGQRVNRHELLLGLMVSSGNDAAMAVAESSTGSMDGFLLRMARNAESLGLEDTRAVEPSGYSALNRSTSLDLGRLAQVYLLRWPWALERYHGVTSFTYPREENLPPGADRSMVAITQFNRNGLLESYEGATGLKTGYIDESGYNIMASADREGMRLLAIVMGIQAPDSRTGSRLREEDASALLDWGFERFDRITLQIDERRLAVRRGEADELLLPGRELELVVPADGSPLSFESREAEVLLAPVSRGQIVALRQWYQNGVFLGEYASRSPSDIDEAGGLRYVWESIVLFFQRLFTGNSPVQGDLSGFSPQ